MLIAEQGLAADRTINTEAGRIKVETFADGLEHPWSLAFLPEGRMLVTERPGRLRLISKDGALSEPLAGVPKVVAQGQGGLLDVALDPDFGANRLVYLSYAEPGEGGASTAVRGGDWRATALRTLKSSSASCPRSVVTCNSGRALPSARTASCSSPSASA